ncbi:MAG: adenine phosphoribosyltransferase [Bacteroidota bacterium]
MNLVDEVKLSIREIPDFPKQGILFKDITPLLSNAALSRKLTKYCAEQWTKEEIQVVVGVESRGFLWGLPLAMALNAPFVPVRKQGKLPAKTESVRYDLEYGSATLEIHVYAFIPGQKVLIHDDLLATGGSASAAAELVTKLGGKVAGFSFLIELSGLGGKDVLSKYSANLKPVVSY